MATAVSEQADTRDVIPEEPRQRYENRLIGLYGIDGDYNALPCDKQEALALLSRRFIELGLWQGVRRIVNVYGEGGVGMNFEADPDFGNLLRARRDFTSMLARRDNTGGFFERSRRRASLHFLYIDRPEAERDWHAHFDFYSPMGSISSALQHLRYERFGNFHPDWRMIKQLL